MTFIFLFSKVADREPPAATQLTHVRGVDGSGTRRSGKGTGRHELPSSGGASSHLLALGAEKGAQRKALRHDSMSDTPSAEQGESEASVTSRSSAADCVPKCHISDISGCRTRSNADRKQPQPVSYQRLRAPPFTSVTCCDSINVKGMLAVHSFIGLFIHHLLGIL